MEFLCTNFVLIPTFWTPVFDPSIGFNIAGWPSRVCMCGVSVGLMAPSPRIVFRLCFLFHRTTGSLLLANIDGTVSSYCTRHMGTSRRWHSSTRRLKPQMVKQTCYGMADWFNLFATTLIYPYRQIVLVHAKRRLQHHHALHN